MLTLRIREIRNATPRARLATLALGKASFRYHAGQSVLVAIHGEDKRRAYSLANAPDDALRDGHLELLIGGDQQGAAAPYVGLQQDALVDVEGPFGTFILPEDADGKRLVFIAGGTGIAPLRAMLRQALKMAPRRIDVVYSARTCADFAFEGELRELSNNGRINLQQTVTRPTACSEWLGARGRIGASQLDGLVSSDPALYFICGPTALVIAVRRLLEERKISANCIRTEDWLKSPNCLPAKTD